MENKEGDFELKNNWTKSVETFDQLEVKKGLLRGIFGNYLFFNGFIRYFFNKFFGEIIFFL